MVNIDGLPTRRQVLEHLQTQDLLEAVIIQDELLQRILQNTGAVAEIGEGAHDLVIDLLEGFLPTGGERTHQGCDPLWNEGENRFLLQTMQSHAGY